jgi:hypothetical protein
MEEFNQYYALAQKMLGDEKVITLVALFEVKVKLCDRDKLHHQFAIHRNALKMIKGNKQVTIKIKS